MSTTTTAKAEPETPAQPERFSYDSLEDDVLQYWDQADIFAATLANREGAPAFIFHEGPPTANGKPGIHHVIARTIKDLVCRYKTMKGFRVDRKGGWDTHGLPVEIEVEKRLGLESKAKVLEYGLDKFNQHCRESVFTYKMEWDSLTRRIGYWLDLEHAYVTLTNDYIETVWWILAQFYKRDLLYQGHKIVPYCPRCGTGLSSHEVALGYDEVKDPSVTITLPLTDEPETAFLAWTTTPWTLISNAALAIGEDIDYVRVVKDGRQYILAEARVTAVLKEDFEITERFKGRTLIGKKYQPLFPWFADQPEEKVFTVLAADFVSTEDGTGIVHMAPAFGADDYEVGRRNGLPVIQPVLADGTFEEKITPYAGQFVKTADKQIIKDLRAAGRLFDAGEILHTYPFCWRCDTPLLYYARQSWYIRTSDFRDKLLERNREINWYPPEIGAGRFGEWLENNVDWALSRERFWGTPLPIWVCESCNETTAVESVADLQTRGSHLPEPLDLHKPYVDEVTLTCQCGGTMRRVPEVIDVWFDSGAMPFAQWHYPFENKENFDQLFPGDFISEGVDQTRGWFYSLHAIAVLLMDKPAYRACVVNEFILDKNGQKMSKTRGNVVDPWDIIRANGADALRWYSLSVSAPWLPTKFDPAGVTEVRNRFFDTWKNTLSFFQLYAEIDSIKASDLLDRPPSNHEFDRWLTSRCASVTQVVDKAYDAYDLTRAVRAIADFVVDDLSNWYVRLNRRRFWASGDSDDKLDAFATLARTLVVVAKLAAPTAPFFSEHVYRALLCDSDRASVHLCDFPSADATAIDTDLERRMEVAQRVVGIGRSARTHARLKTRQPLAEVVIVPPADWKEKDVTSMRELIAEELNVKAVTLHPDVAGIGKLTLKANFAVLGKRLGGKMKSVAAALGNVTPEQAEEYRRSQTLKLDAAGQPVTLGAGDLLVDIEPEPGYHAESDGRLIVGIDTRLDDALRAEGFARELINRVQNARKKSGLAVTDRINLTLSSSEDVVAGLQQHADRIQGETLAVEFVAATEPLADGEEIDLNGQPATIKIAAIRD